MKFETFMRYLIWIIVAFILMSGLYLAFTKLGVLS